MAAVCRLKLSWSFSDTPNASVTQTVRQFV
jgi:hypothetical protein